MAAIGISKTIYGEQGHVSGSELRSRPCPWPFRILFGLLFVPDMEFHVNCGISRTRFMVEALEEVREPIPLVPFSIRGYLSGRRVLTGGPSFAMFANLYIRKSIVWGCNAYCGRVSPKAGLLSAAVSDLSIPILVRNLLTIL